MTHIRMKFALVTGASSGIGEQLALELAARGYGLVLIARRMDKLEALAALIRSTHQVEAHPLQEDLSDPDAPGRVREWLVSHKISLQILVNNAGYTIWERFDSVPESDWQEMLHVNLHAPVKLCQMLLPLLREHSPAYILNVSSTTAFQGVPFMSVYTASKAFVRFFSRSLHYELKSEQVHVCCLMPGTTRSEFMERANMMALAPTAEKVMMSAQKVAQAGIKGLFRKKIEVIPGFINKIQSLIVALRLKPIFEKGAYKIYNRP